MDARERRVRLRDRPESTRRRSAASTSTFSNGARRAGRVFCSSTEARRTPTGSTPSPPRSDEHRHVVALDQRGHGESAWATPPAYATEDFAADIVGVLGALGWDSAVLIGHSMGGHNAIGCAAWHPERLRGLVIVDSRPAIPAERLAQMKERGARPHRRHRASRRPPPRSASCRPTHARSRPSSPIWRARASTWQDGAVSLRFDPACYAARVPADGWQLVARIAAPTLVVRGELSPILTRPMAERLRRRDCRRPGWWRSRGRITISSWTGPRRSSRRSEASSTTWTPAAPARAAALAPSRRARDGAAAGEVERPVAQGVRRHGARVHPRHLRDVGRVPGSASSGIARRPLPGRLEPRGRRGDAQRRGHPARARASTRSSTATPWAASASSSWSSGTRDPPRPASSPTTVYDVFARPGIPSLDTRSKITAATDALQNIIAELGALYAALREAREARR